MLYFLRTFHCDILWKILDIFKTVYKLLSGICLNRWCGDETYNFLTQKKMIGWFPRFLQLLWHRIHQSIVILWKAHLISQITTTSLFAFFKRIYSKSKYINYRGPWEFLSLFQPTFLSNSAFENDSSDWVLRYLKLSTKILRKINKKWSESDHCFQFLNKNW